MVCVAVKGIPLIGVIHRPFTDETYWSVVGHGNSANLDDMVSKRRDNSKEFRVIVSRSHAGDARNLTKHILGAQEPVKIIQAAGAGN
jgi:inositol monophosphatase 3